MTTMNCECKGTQLIFLENKNLYCPKCDKITQEQIILDSDPQEQAIKENTSGSESKPVIIEKVNSSKDFDSDDFNLEEQMTDFNQKLLVNKEKAEEASKKIGQLLLQGWAMLNESCPECLQPIMKSKQGVRLCVQCNREERTDIPKKPVEQLSIPIQQQVQPKHESTLQKQQIEAKQQIEPQAQINLKPSQQEPDKLGCKAQAESIVVNNLICYYEALQEQLSEYDQSNLIVISQSIQKTEQTLHSTLRNNSALTEVRLNCLKEVSKNHEKFMSLKQFDRAIKLMNILVMMYDIIQKQ
ncbi:hypothetical protein FGO68_gene16246 [Halteria grandinella]|uniref:Sjoegren syndrome/scleroderma autoantigen 1 n=1 Tax=Halteria grandinella TaxID=5974 RepID=A0A8J8NFP6_HALGN|nr:hypothetical protein FGO68_gene16246 [Halteria grandinella]